MVKSRVFYDQDTDPSILNDKTIAVIGYGNQGRTQALNLKDSSLKVIIGCLPDKTRDQAVKDKFQIYSIADAAVKADILLFLIPDEVMPEVFETDIKPGLKKEKTICFASGYNVAFNLLQLPRDIDVILVAPRMIGVGVRGNYLEGKGFPSFIGVHQDISGKALQTALAIARGIGSTRSGAIEVTFTQEAVMDLFTEQAFLPAFFQLLTMSMKTLVSAGYAPEAVLIELFLSNEFAYVCDKMVEMGIFKQMALHSHTSQYGQLTRTPRFANASILRKLKKALDEIESGAFAKEWTAEQKKGLPIFKKMKRYAHQSQLARWERKTRKAFRMD